MERKYYSLTQKRWNDQDDVGRWNSRKDGHQIRLVGHELPEIDLGTSRGQQRS